MPIAPNRQYPSNGKDYAKNQSTEQSISRLDMFAAALTGLLAGYYLHPQPQKETHHAHLPR